MNDDPAARGVVMTPANINRFKRIELIESVTASDDISKEKSDRPKTHHRIVSQLLRSSDFTADPSGNVYRYNGHYWEEVSDTCLNHLALLAAREADIETPTPSSIRQSVDYLRMVVTDPEFAFQQLGDSEVALYGGVLDILNMETRSHEPDDYLENVLPLSFEAGATCDLFKSCLKTWFDDDEELINGLQEFFGYVCLPHAKFKKALLLYGPGNTGKSVILWLLQQLVGRKNCCSLGVDQMDNLTRLSVIKGKRLNIVTEISERSLVADGSFKTLVSTEEPILIDRKYKDPETYISRCKHAIASNTLPNLPGRSAEILDRLLILPMDQPVLRPDPGLREKLQKELPGILAWALEGARRLTVNKGEFTRSTKSDLVQGDWDAVREPFYDWFQENMHCKSDERTPLLAIANRCNAITGRRYSARDIGAFLRNLGYDDKIKSARPRPTEREKAEMASRNSVKCLVGFGFSAPTSDQLRSCEFEKDDS